MGGGVKFYSDKKEQQIAEQKKPQYTLHNPKIEDVSSVISGQKKVTWDCLWFGSYPQSQITAEDGEIYTILTNIDNWNKNGDVIIENTKYHKTEKDYFKKPFYCPMLFWISNSIMKTINMLHGKKVH